MTSQWIEIYINVTSDRLEHMSAEKLASAIMKNIKNNHIELKRIDQTIKLDSTKRM